METADLFLSLLFGSIGFGYYLYGRRRKNMVTRYCGIAMILYPYIANNAWDMLAVCVVLMVLPRFVEL